MEPTFRFLRLGEAQPGQFVENLGDTEPALDYPPSFDRLLYAGHPGRVERDYEDGLGGHVVVIWHGLEDTEESSTGVGHSPDANGDYLGLGWLDEATYTDRVRRLTAAKILLLANGTYDVRYMTPGSGSPCVARSLS